MKQNMQKCIAIENYLLFFFLGSLIGWFWEAAVYWIGTAPKPSIAQIILEFRGVLHGPWVPIYGVGGVLICLLASHIGKRPFRVFLISSVVCGLIEYMTSWILEVVYHARWWDYSNQFLNLNGRISALSVFFFGFAGMAVAFLLKPVFDRWTLHLSPLRRNFIVIFISILFLLDCVCSLVMPNMGIGVDIIGGNFL